MAASDFTGLAGTGVGTAFGGPVGGAIGGGIGQMLGGLFGGSSDPEALWRQYLAQLPSYAELVKAGQTGPSAFGSIAEDPVLRAAQLNALQQMQGVSTAGGLDPQSRAAMLEAQSQTGQANRAAQQAALQQMAMRGQAGGGAELAAKLSANQSATQANAMAGAQGAADARSRALQAMASSGSMAGNVRGQDWSNAAQRAQAADTISQFNASNRLNAYGMRMGALGQGFSGLASGSNEKYQRGVGMGGAAGAGLGGLAQYAWGNGGGGAQPTGYQQPEQYQLKSGWPGGY